jgi:predicted transport protein
MVIQSVPKWKETIVEGHSIGHSEQKVYMYMCPIQNDLRDRTISLYSCSKIVDKKEILRTVSNTGIFCSGDKIGPVYLV